ncbi:MAG: type VI secretion system secreted protein Hcp [Gammaproteobacteria bacterium]|jgi:type VI secretion system secreted protein Hcp
MPLQMMMKIDGVIGDSKSFKHKGWADILSWNWGLTSNRKSSQGVDGDKTNLNELSIIKVIGNDSSGIRLLFAQGKTIPNVEFSISPVVAKREPAKSYVDIKMENVVIKSIITGGGIDDDFFKEHITLLYEKIRFEYNRNIGADEKIREPDFEWNVPDNAEWAQ